MTGPADTTLLVLAGGKGTRLRSLDSTRPKPMVPVKGKPFLHWLVDHYAALGYRDFIFSTGHLAEVFEQYDWNGEFAGCRFTFERESEPLGTGGATRAIFEKLGLKQAWVINGDTLLPTPLPSPRSELEALYTALEKNELFDASPNLAVENDLVVAESSKGQYFDGGAVHIKAQAIARFEKAKGPAKCSLHELLAPAMAARRVGYALVPGTCYDIGTPERFKRFESYLESSRNA